MTGRVLVPGDPARPTVPRVAGDPSPLGVHLVPGGLSVAVLAPDATQIDLCLFAPPPEGGPTADLREVARLPLPDRDGPMFHGLITAEALRRVAPELPVLGPGLVYGLRAHGPWAPREGHFFNPDKLLLDPYARAVQGDVTFCDAVFAHDRSSGLMQRSRLDSAAFVPKGSLVDEEFSWGDDRSPAVPWGDTVIYEAQVRWMTARHPAVPPALRGTYLGLAHPAVLDHLIRLGVTTLELLPVHFCITEERLRGLGLVNAWGYGTLGFFAPDPRFATAPERARVEFKAMVRALHAAGIEVILDVVYNHTIEGPTDGPTLSLRGLGNAAYYRLDPADRRRTVDYSGCGNSLDCSREPARRLVLDSLRHWVSELHVDGFRLDLAPALFREGGSDAFAPDGTFARALREDPVLRSVKWIAEPWDLGPRGYRVGEFAPPVVQWNDRFRDGVRRFWRGDQGQLPGLATRLAGSSDLAPGRGPLAFVHFVACHDGFTLHDLTAYAHKHNRANGEENRDGSGANWSSGWGAEGPSEDLAVVDLRGRVGRSLLATVVFALGVPMIGQGDEAGRSQGGNNNAYCQDDSALWVPWGEDADQELTAFVAHAFALRRQNAVFRRETFLPHDPAVVRWLAADGTELVGARWHHPPDRGHTLVMLLRAEGEEGRPRREVLSPARDALLILHAGDADITVRLPLGTWRVRLDASRPALRAEEVATPTLHISARSFLLIERT